MHGLPAPRRVAALSQGNPDFRLGRRSDAQKKDARIGRTLTGRAGEFGGTPLLYDGGKE
jgi:hypothetical protein